MEPKSIVDLKFGLNCGWEKVKAWDCFHRHDEIEFTFFPEGEPIIYRFGGKLVEIMPRQSVLFWGAIPHQLVEIAAANVQYWLTIPPEMFLRWDLPERLVQDVLDGKMIVEVDEQLRALDVLCFPVWKNEASSNQAEARKTMGLSVEARFRRFAHRAEESGEARRFKPGYLIPREKNAFLDMYDYITLNYRRPLRIEDVAAAAKLHANYAISLFKAKCGINIVEFITMLRVYEAQRLLLTTDMKIIDISLEAGFGSLSNFYKCFTKICRKNPKEYRKYVAP